MTRYIKIPVVEDMGDMNDQTLAYVMGMEKIVTGFFEAAKAEALARINAGKKVPGWALGPGKRSRAWKSESAAIEGMANAGINDPYSRELLTPAAVEKKLNEDQKALLKDYWEWHPGNPSLKQSAGSAAVIAPEFDDDVLDTSTKPSNAKPDW